jgi:hypothetical protein
MDDNNYLSQFNYRIWTCSRPDISLKSVEVTKHGILINEECLIPWESIDLARGFVLKYFDSLEKRLKLASTEEGIQRQGGG